MARRLSQFERFLSCWATNLSASLFLPPFIYRIFIVSMVIIAPLLPFTNNSSKSYGRPLQPFDSALNHRGPKPYRAELHSTHGDYWTQVLHLGDIHCTPGFEIEELSITEVVHFDNHPVDTRCNEAQQPDLPHQIMVCLSSLSATEPRVSHQLQHFH